MRLRPRRDEGALEPPRKESGTARLGRSVKIRRDVLILDRTGAATLVASSRIPPFWSTAYPRGRHSRVIIEYKWRKAVRCFDFPKSAYYCLAMESLHAPWRIEYILAPKPLQTDSLFSRIGQSTDDESHYVIARGRSCFALLNTYPYTGGHLMVVPYKQVQDFNGLNDEELAELLKMTRRCQNALSRVMKPHGFNVGINLGKVAGAGIVEHLHIHVVPRWDGDTNFMPVIASTTVVPQALAELAAQLRAALTDETLE
jgi:ATP adenylyltransferase